MTKFDFHSSTRDETHKMTEETTYCDSCDIELTEDIHIFCLFKNDEEKTWCQECFEEKGEEARVDGWTFDEQGEEMLDEKEN